jgi:hypothetical protein
MHSFGIPSIPQDFFNFKEFINFCKSRVLIFQVAVSISFEQSLDSKPPHAVHGFHHTVYAV